MPSRSRRERRPAAVAVGRRQQGDVVVLQLQGSFFGDRETDEFDAALRREAAAGNLRLVVDARGCEAMNSIGLGVLMSAYANYRRRGGEIKLCGVDRRLRDLLTLTRLIGLFDVHETEEEALAAFAAG